MKHLWKHGNQCFYVRSRGAQPRAIPRRTLKEFSLLFILFILYGFEPRSSSFCVASKKSQRSDRIAQYRGRVAMRNRLYVNRRVYRLSENKCNYIAFIWSVLTFEQRIKSTNSGFPLRKIKKNNNRGNVNYCFWFLRFLKIKHKIIKAQTTNRALTAHKRYLMQRIPTSRWVAAILDALFFFCNLTDPQEDIFSSTSN